MPFSFVGLTTAMHTHASHCESVSLAAEGDEDQDEEKE